MSTVFLNSEILLPKKYIYDNEYSYHKSLGKDQNNNERIFYIKHEPEWDGEMGSCIEFSINDSKLLLAYCTDESDFINVLNRFNV